MADSLYRQILDRTVQVLKEQHLQGIRDDEIVVREFPDDGQITYSGITVSPAEEKVDTYWISRERIGYPCIVTVNKGTDKDDSDIDPRTDNRRTIRKAFHHKRAPAATLCDNYGVLLLPCTAEYGPQQLPKQYHKNWSENRMVVWFWLLESRV